MCAARKKQLRPIQHQDARAYVSVAARRVRAYERRYEMPTEKMRSLVASGGFPETAEISKWFQDANEIAFLETRIAQRGLAGRRARARSVAASSSTSASISATSSRSASTSLRFST